MIWLSLIVKSWLNCWVSMALMMRLWLVILLWLPGRIGLLMKMLKHRMRLAQNSLLMLRTAER